jgi:hypothetical protein
LLIVPDGFLNFIPFEALVTAAPGTGVSLRNASYLIRNQELRYAWSLAVLRQQNKMQSQAENYLLALAPGFTNGERGLAPLRAGSEEWQSAGRSTTKLLGQEADLQHFSQELVRHRVVHFATHAFSDQNPRIELYDQSLLLPDVYALPLRADLVVLSACQCDEPCTGIRPGGRGQHRIESLVGERPQHGPGAGALLSKYECRERDQRVAPAGQTRLHHRPKSGRRHAVALFLGGFDSGGR